MKKRLLIGLLSGALALTLALPGAAVASCSFAGEHPDILQPMENFGAPPGAVAGPRLTELGWEWYREPTEGTPNTPGQNIRVATSRCTP